jgi:hypothetical protein
LPIDFPPLVLPREHYKEKISKLALRFASGPSGLQAVLLAQRDVKGFINGMAPELVFYDIKQPSEADVKAEKDAKPTSNGESVKEHKKQ